MFDENFSDSIDPDLHHFDQFSESNGDTDTICNYVTFSDYDRIMIDKKSALTILNYNIRSFNSNFDTFIASFNNYDVVPDILTLSETWFTETSLTEIPHFRGYHTIRPQRSGGVSVYVKDKIESKKIPHLSFCNSSLEVCTTEILTKHRNFYLIAIYRPHSNEPFENFLSNLNNVLSNELLRNKSQIVLGDFNINHLDDSPRTISFLNCMQSYYMLPLITKPTRFPPNDSGSPSLLDQIWTNKPTASYKCGIILSDLTDHYPTYYHTPIPVDNSSHGSEKIKISFRLINEENNDRFALALSSFDWSFIETLSVDTSVEFFISQLNSLYQKYFPLKTKYISLKKALNPWMNDYISKLIKYKSQYYSLMKLGITSITENKKFKNKVNSIVRAAKVSYFENKFSSNRSDMRKTWSLINEIISPNSKKSNIIKILAGGNLISDQLQISELFNSYFSNIALNLRSNIPDSSLDAINLVQRSYYNFFLYPVTPDECSKIVQTLKITKTPLNEFPVKLFKKHDPSLTPILSKLITKCFSVGEFPKCLKVATIIPIFKNGDPVSLKNYRPISILPYIAKIYEKCLYNRLLNFFINHNLFSPQQFGFLPGKSTVDALINFLEFQYDALNSREFSVCVFVDLAKAFDTLDHNILVGKLERYGVRGLPLKLIRSYISDRKYRVKIGPSCSATTTSNIGTAQGSVLAALFFIIYVNDLPQFLKKSHPIIYADDTTICLKNPSLRTALDECNSELSNLSEWCKANKLTINLNKSYFMLISNKPPPSITIQLKIDNAIIHRVETHKFLGVTIDSKLKFGDHISEISKKISKSIGIIYKLSVFLPTSTLKNLYYALVHSHLMYCNALWGGTNQTHLQPLIVLQKKMS